MGLGHARVASLAAGVVLALGGLLWIGLASGTGLSTALPWAIDRYGPPGWDIRLESVEGSWLGPLWIRGVSAESEEEGVLEADSVYVRYSPRDLLRRVVHVHEVVLYHPTVRAELWTDRDDHVDQLEEPEANAPGNWTFSLDAVRAVAGEMALETRSGPYRVVRWDLLGRVRFGSSLISVEVDSMGAEVIPADHAPPVRISAAGAAFDGKVLSLGHLSLQSERSSVAGSGSVAFSGTGMPVPTDVGDLVLVADPLDLRDLPLGWDSLHASTLTADLRAVRDSKGVGFQLDVQGPGETVVAASGHLLEAGLEGTVHAERVPLRLTDALSGPSLGADLRIEASELRRSTAFEVSGTLAYHPGSEVLDADGSRRTPQSRSLLARPFTMEIDATGQSLRLDSLVLDADVTIADAASEIVGRADVTLSPGRAAAWSGRVQTLGGSLTSAGRGRLEGDTVLVESAGIRFESFDVSAFSASFPITSLTGAGFIAGSYHTENMEGDLELRLSPSQVGSVAIDTAYAAMAFFGDEAAGLVEADILDGSVRADLATSLDDSTLSATIRNGRFVSLSLPISEGDISDGEEEMPSDLNGAFEGEARVGGGEPFADLAVQIDSSHLGRTTITGGSLDILLEEGRGEAVGVLDLGEYGSADVRAEVEGIGESFALHTITGEGEASFRGDLPKRGRIEDSHLLVSADSGRLTYGGFVRPADAGGQIDFRGDGRIGEGFVEIQASADGSIPNLAAALEATEHDARLDTLRLVVGGRWEDGDLSSGNARLALGGGKWDSLHVESAQLVMSMDSSALRLDSLSLSSNLLTLSGGGAIPGAGRAPGRIDIVGQISDLAPLSSVTGNGLVTGGTGSVIMSVEGTLDLMRVAAQATLGGAILGDYRVSDFRLDGSGTIENPGDAESRRIYGDLALDLQRVLTRGPEFLAVSLRASGGPDSIAIDLSADVNDQRNLRIGVHLDPRPEYRTVLVEELTLQLDADAWQIVAPAVVSYRDGIFVDSLSLISGDQSVRIRGGIDSEGVFALNAAVDSTNIDTAADLLGFPDLAGWIDFDLDMSGPYQTPAGSLDLTADVGRETLVPGQILLTLDSDGDNLRVDARLEHPDGQPLTAVGILPIEILPPWDTTVAADAQALVDVRVQSEGLPLEWLSPLAPVDAVQNIGGTVAADLSVQGPFRDLSVTGDLEGEELIASFPRLGVTYSGGHLRARGEGKELVVDTLWVYSGPGRAFAEGSISSVEPRRLDLNVAFGNFRAVQTSELDALTSGFLNVNGTLAEPVVTGEVELLSLDLHLDRGAREDGLEDVALTRADLDMLRERFGYVPSREEEEGRANLFLDRLTVDLNVEMGRDSWVRRRTSPQIALPFSGEVMLTLEPGGEIQMNGTLDAIPQRGFVEQFGRRFEVISGTVDLSGDPLSASVQVESQYSVPSHENPNEAEVAIVLSLEGTRDDLELVLSSEPSMDNADIVSYLATGRPASGPGAFEGAIAGDRVASRGAGLALDQLIDVIEHAADGNAGLDIVEIRMEGLSEATLVAGKYVSPRLYIGFAQPISGGGEADWEVEVEYEAHRWLILNLEGSSEDVSFFFRGRRAY